MNLSLCVCGRGIFRIMVESFAASVLCLLTGGFRCPGVLRPTPPPLVGGYGLSSAATLSDPFFGIAERCGFSQILPPVSISYASA